MVVVVVAVEWEPSAFNSSDDRGLRVGSGVRPSGAPDGAMVRWGAASACDTPPDGGGKSWETVGSEPDVTPGEEEGVASGLGAAAEMGGVQRA